MPPPIRIRRLGRSDIGPFQILRLHSLQDEPAAYSTAVREERAHTPASIRSRLKQDVVLGAELEERLVGFVGLHRLEGDRFAHRGVVWGLYVVPDMRRQGIALRLMEALEDEARTLVRIIELEVIDTNVAAWRLYQALGYHEYGRFPNALCFDGQYLGQVFMYKEAQD